MKTSMCKICIEEQFKKLGHMKYPLQVQYRLKLFTYLLNKKARAR